MNPPGSAPAARRRAWVPAVLLLVSWLPSCAPAPAVDPATASEAFLEGRYGSRTVALEIADDPREREKGLMDRPTLAPDRGMLFLFEEEAVHPFWMHNTRFPLDIIHLDAGLRIVGIIRRARPESDKILSIGKPSRYVLEVEGGLCDRLGIGEGDSIILR